ncbi:penicillin-binding protein, partial [Pseudoxanthomonas sp. SGD-10]
AYGYYGVRLRESLRLQIAPADSIPDSLQEDSAEDLFKFFDIKKDSVTENSSLLMKIFAPKEDTVKKSARELRRERRQKRREGADVP